MSQREDGGSPVADRMLSRLQGFADALEKGEKISERFTCRSIELKLEPAEYDADGVKKMRHSLGLSQAVFAKYLGVSVKTLQSWEQGKPVPTIARRFMDEIKRDPKQVIENLKKAATPA
ncbi:MAG: helix-turn-helix domain-containing protein [Planctomycetia bacterium]